MISSPLTISYGLENQQMSPHIAESGRCDVLASGVACGEATDLVDDHGGSY